MKLLLHIEAKGVPSAILDAAYAFFPPYKFTDSGNGILSTTIDAAHDLTDEQWAIVVQMNPTVDLVLPDGLVPPVPVASPSPSPMTAPIPVVVSPNGVPITGTVTLSEGMPFDTTTNTFGPAGHTVVLG